ncbi:TetR/AcrR family transcriptional regulator [Cellulomonas xiejunii]|uniref:TetR/AcrR family transcriptional regulator n=1 Tax=Cellulomonas xiejunii TaxID=2968083 RepID=A0ABY5KS22_9CELL|nr:TetR/AcrR family transcriptional regulator [Cellulomonas xiejunii]MCC2321995.1 TetR/AcrR family transcriptional regulator [Cellulomonas xiejunii]UUI73291.1 TetR/AcrR family transcriptional regulator [Cellulomonas xiejunii]
MARPRTHDDALRERLLDEATRAVADDGAAALTVRDAAARAGTSSSAVYALFGGRDALLQAVGDRAAARFAARLRDAPATGEPGADLLALGVAYRRFALDEPQAYRVMFARPGAGVRHPASGPVSEVPTFVVLRDAVTRVLAAAAAAPLDPDGPDHPGSVGSADGDAAAAGATGLWALTHGWVMLEIDGLLPWPPHERDARYVATLRGAGPGLLRAATHGADDPDGPRTA